MKLFFADGQPKKFIVTDDDGKDITDMMKITDVVVSTGVHHEHPRVTIHCLCEEVYGAFMFDPTHAENHRYGPVMKTADDPPKLIQRCIQCNAVQVVAAEAPA